MLADTLLVLAIAISHRMRVAKTSSWSGRLSIRVELSPTVYETSPGFDVGTAGSDSEAKKTTRQDETTRRKTHICGKISHVKIKSNDVLLGAAPLLVAQRQQLLAETPKR